MDYDTVKGVNEKFFDQDLTINKDGIAKTLLTISTDSTIAIEVTFDGTNFIKLTNPIIYIANSLYLIKDIHLLKTDKFNMRTPTSGGCKIKVCRIQEFPPVYSSNGT